MRIPPSEKGQAARLTQKTAPISSTNLHVQGGPVNSDTETIALLSEAVWLLTGIYNLQIEQLNTLQDIKRRLP